jgi:hypothetical protein
MAAQGSLYFQFWEIQHPLLASEKTRHIYGAHTCRQSIHTYKIKIINASPVYRVSSRTARATQRNSGLKTEQNKKQKIDR